ncbi:MAG: Glutamate racemase [Candidatus Amesbacteria bacterium GW2011_GWA2_42_12]|uniref:Glutamate racemase n=1 Tax=Candidatus Amesbacteria bacterium GW2011_GWA2_42_12 TaxID=1618356 RepID=A0A0G0Y6Q8_9BACT|nr:MAG: Glutamate racemase [Candidatus Amesbacteria bacterium GW2011_GWA2_42_12]
MDTLILGCTHYPIIQGLVQQVLGDRVTLINPGEELAKILNLSDSEGNDEYFVTDLTPRYAEIAKRFLGKTIEPKLVKLG